MAVVGSRVMVRGLSKAAQYNGQFGIVSEIIDKDGQERLCVVLEGSGRQLSVKRDNAEVVKARPAASGSNPMAMALNTMFKPKLSATGGSNLYEEPRSRHQEHLPRVKRAPAPHVSAQAHTRAGRVAEEWRSRTLTAAHTATARRPAATTARREEIACRVDRWST